MTEPEVQDLGSGLRRAREQSGLSLRAIADVTKLSTRTLAALEENRIDLLPGGIYRRAIVRAYAAEVGLDPEQTLRAFLSRHPDEVPTAAPPVEPRPPRPGARALRAVAGLLGALIPVLAGVIYFTSTAGGSQRPPDIVDLLPPPARGWSPEAVPASHIDDAASMTIAISADTELQVVADGREVLARRVAAGEIFELDVATDVVLMGDNAGAVQFSINGQAGRTLGADGAPLGAHILRDNYLYWLRRR